MMIIINNMHEANGTVILSIVERITYEILEIIFALKLVKRVQGNKVKETNEWAIKVVLN